MNSALFIPEKIQNAQCSIPSNVKNLSNLKFDRITIISFSHIEKEAGMWNVRCDCGKQYVIKGSRLTSGISPKSCGCHRSEVSRKKATKHGKCGTPEHKTWATMLRRCKDPKMECYSDYGGRGIRVCPEWENSFEEFLKDMGRKPTPKHSIDRMDANGNYEPSNCRWATKQEQANNKRSSIWIDWKGQLLTLAQVCRLENFNYGTVKSRLRKGWAKEEALTKNKRGGRPLKEV